MYFAQCRCGETYRLEELPARNAMRCHKCWRALAFAAETGVADEARGAAVPGQSSPEREAAWSPSAEPSRPAFFTGPGGAPWRLFLVIPVLVIFLLLILLRRTNVPMPDAAPRELSHEEVVEFSQTPVGPVAYGIGAVDPRFDLSEERLRTLVREAVAVWEGAAGRTLFREDAAARLKVNLIFDERQQRRLDENRLKSDIEARDTSRNVLIGDYETERALAGRLEEDYKADAAALSRRVDAYNAAVASWNARGGAPPDELERLRTEQAAITAATDAAERKRRRLNEVLDDVRSLAESINNLGSRNNREIRDYNGRFGEGREFEKGVYDGGSINIYQFDADDDLRLTLVHELGHALGFGHVDDPGAVMYYKLAGQPMQPIRLAADDLKLLNGRNQGAVAGRTP